MKHQDAFYIGYITKTRGLKGEVQLFFEFEDYLDLDLQLLFIEQQGSLVPFFAAQVKVLQNSTAFIFFEDYTHIDQVKPLVKAKVYLSNDKMPVRDESEFYVTDLIHYTVIDKKFGTLGEISQVQEMPQQVIATVNFNGNEIMFPINDDFILEINEENKILEVELPDGLLDIYLNP